MPRNSYLSLLLILFSYITQAQENGTVSLNDTTEIIQLGEGKYLKVKYYIDGAKIVSIAEKNRLVKLYPAMNQEFSINKKDSIGIVSLHVPKVNSGFYQEPFNNESKVPYTIDIAESNIGKAFPPFEWVDIEGKKYSNMGLEGKVIVLNFWHTSCVPCVAEMPVLNELEKKYDTTKVAFISTTPNTKVELLKFLTHTTFRYKHVPAIDPRLYFDPMPGWPIHVVIDSKGKIQFITLGKQPEIEKKLGTVINSLL